MAVANLSVWPFGHELDGRGCWRIAVRVARHVSPHTGRGFEGTGVWHVDRGKETLGLRHSPGFAVTGIAYVHNVKVREYGNVFKREPDLA
jgi:hypothetical protein